MTATTDPDPPNSTEWRDDGPSLIERRSVMNDADVLGQIKHLVDEEHRLETSHVGDAVTDAEQARLRELEVALDQCWDLLRQRRARRTSGQDPDAASVRTESVVEGYKQ